MRGHERAHSGDRPKVRKLAFPQSLVKVPVADGFAAEGRSRHSGTLNKGVDFSKEGGNIGMQFHDRMS